MSVFFTYVLLIHSIDVVNFGKDLVLLRFWTVEAEAEVEVEAVVDVSVYAFY